eukprot:2469715-Pyramimonas_sp.AAC.1
MESNSARKLWFTNFAEYKDKRSISGITGLLASQPELAQQSRQKRRSTITVQGRLKGAVHRAAAGSFNPSHLYGETLDPHRLYTPGFVGPSRAGGLPPPPFEYQAPDGHHER